MKESTAGDLTGWPPTERRPLRPHRVEIVPLLPPTVEELAMVIRYHLKEGVLHGGLKQITMTGAQAKLLVDAILKDEPR